MIELFFDDIFKVECVDPDGKKYDKVSRIEARSEKHDMFMLLDVNTDIYPINEGEKFVMVLSSSLNYNGAAVTSYESQEGQKSLADKFEYIMHGKLYKFSEQGSGSGGNKVEVYVSFGGLQMMLMGDPSHCSKFGLDQTMFLLIRKLP